MNYICRECEAPCIIDAGKKVRSYPDLCPWPGVKKESYWLTASGAVYRKKRLTFDDWWYHEKSNISRRYGVVSEDDLKRYFRACWNAAQNPDIG